VIRTLSIETRGRGLTDCTDAVGGVVRAASLDEGLCTLFVQHTSASLLIQENVDPSVLQDLERFFARLAPDGDRIWTHTQRGHGRNQRLGGKPRRGRGNWPWPLVSGGPSLTRTVARRNSSRDYGPKRAPTTCLPT
jgi:hypothetical protein